jgi:RNA polymerase sigma factor (sigma-70 family)
MSARVRLPNPLTVLDDHALLARFTAERDQPAFEQLVKRHGALVFGVCQRAVRDRHLAEDAFQAVFLVLARTPTRAAEATSVGGWLFGVARRVGLAARRHEQRREKHEARCRATLREPDTGMPPAPRSDLDDLFRMLDEELGALPDDLRAALVACFLEERTQDEAAHELGWSLSTLRRRLDRGKELLRSRLARRGLTLAAGLFAVSLSAPARGAVPTLAAPTPTSTALAAAALGRGISAKLLASALGFALVVGGAAFGLATDRGDRPDPPPAVNRALPAGPAPAPAPRAVEPKKWVTVSGRIVYAKNRAAPAPRPVLAESIKDKDVWAPFAPLVYEDLLVHGTNRGLANAVVFLRPDSNDRKAAFPADAFHPDRRAEKPAERTVVWDRGQFAPRILLARAGDTVRFDNRLPVANNVHYTVVGADGGRDFNVLVGKGMSHTTKPLTAVTSPDQYKSDIYPWMSGFVWAFDHPYAAVTDADGKFEIKDAPAGKWRLAVWHEGVGYLGGPAGRLGTKLTIPESPAGTLELDPLSFDSDRWPE